jgi:oxygen-independent coproporphyrinogen-3 oxidase
MQREMEIQARYLPEEPLSSIYFGGGTPSLLSIDEIGSLFRKIQEIWQVQPGAEITLEANPDDLSVEKLQALRDTPVNRLSIGIQSFSEADLQFMNRAHNAREANECLDNTLKAGFDNLSVDLIYGSPTTSDAQWAANVDRVLAYRIPHLSCYCLTVEPRTALDHFVRKGKAKPVDDEQASRQFHYLVDRLEDEGYDHYEISNFARPGHYAVHNANYWLGVPYLGIGPSAHSYNKKSRQWNVANNARYMKALNGETTGEWFEREELRPTDRYNEYIMTRLRTIWGIAPQDMEAPFRDHFLNLAPDFVDRGHLEITDGIYRLSRSGKFLADRIASDLFY